MVGSAQRAVAHAAGHADDLHIRVGVGHVHLHLLGGAGGIEAGGAADEGNQARAGQTRRDAHRVLLGDAALHELLRQLLHEIIQGYAAPAVGRQRKDALVLPRQLQQRLGKCLSCSLHAQSTPFTPSAS